MGQRNMPPTSQMIDLEMNQQNQRYLHPEPSVLLGGITSFPQPDTRTMVTASQSTTNLDAHHLPDHYNNAMFYGMPQYHGVQHHRHAANLDLGVATASNFYLPYMTPSSGIPVHHGSSDQLPSSSNYGVIGVSADEYGRISHFMNNFRGSYKRKNAEGNPGSFQFFNAQASSSSSVPPLSTRHSDGVAATDSTSYTMPQYRGHGPPSIREVGSQRSVRNRLGAAAVMDPVLVRNHNHFIQGNYMGQPFQPAGSLWLDQQLGNNSSEGGASAWTQAPVNLQHRNFHHLPPPIQGARGHNVNVHPQVAAASYRVPTTYASHGTMNPSQDGLEMRQRHVGPVPPTGLRIYRSHREGSVPETIPRHRNLPQLRVLPNDGVAVLEIQDYYEVENLMDHHRDMRLDIEDMSYEELLALGERIGNVNNGLSSGTITAQLKTKTYLSASKINLEEAASVTEEPDSCIICQEDYVNYEKIGILKCGHEYHADCLKKWLLVKNVCPICKAEGLAMGGNDA